jgi:hypothetical protein
LGGNSTVLINTSGLYNIVHLVVGALGSMWVHGGAGWQAVPTRVSRRPGDRGLSSSKLPRGDRPPDARIRPRLLRWYRA